MNECRTCPKEKRVSVERPHKSVLRKHRYTSRTTNNSYEPYPGSIGDYYPVKNCDTCGLSQCKPMCFVERRCAPCVEPCYKRPVRCSPCAEPCFEYPRRCDPCLDPCLDWPGRCNPCLDPSTDRSRCNPCIDPCNYCPENTDSGLLHTIRNGFQRIFTGRKRNCAPLYKGKVYNYSTTQLKFMERQLDKMEDEAKCLECAVKEAFECGTPVSCTNLRCSLTALAEKLECLRCDLSCAYDCYDPCRDKCEFDLICCLLERISSLDVLLNDLYLQLECLEYQSACAPRMCSPCKPQCQKPCCVPPPRMCSPCKPQCQKPCCVPPPRMCNPCKPQCEKPCCVPRSWAPCKPQCEKSCCAPRKRCRSCKPNLCRKSSVIPLGVMLVKL